MAKIARELSEVVTVKVPKSMMEKLDRLSVELCRSRADTIRRLIAGATVTGHPDLTATLKGGHDAAGRAYGEAPSVRWGPRCNLCSLLVTGNQT
jgi:predicted transcriptional regulator